MGAEIAAMVAADGTAGVLDEPGEIVVYRRTETGWNEDRRMNVALGQCQNLSEMRQMIAGVIRFLDGCRIFMAGTAGGALSFELQKARCSVWEIEGSPADSLESILEEEEREQAAPAPDVLTIPGPEEISPGEYFISIKEVQGKMPGVTSKQVLAQFIADGNFRMLEVLCDHVPPWIEIEAKVRGYGLDMEKNRPNEFIVRLTGTVA